MGDDTGDRPESAAARRKSEAERQAEARRARAAQTLRDNLMKRKQQGRARRAGAADETSGLPAAPSASPTTAGSGVAPATEKDESRD